MSAEWRGSKSEEDQGLTLKPRRVEEEIRSTRRRGEGEEGGGAEGGGIEEDERVGEEDLNISHCSK
jgi:hypothetical protein